MKTLPEKIRKNGFEYIQVLKGNRSRVYKQRVHENRCNYEVFLIKINPERKIGNKTIKANERFPNDEAFGSWAWTYKTYEEALKKFNEIEKKK